MKNSLSDGRSDDCMKKSLWVWEVGRLYVKYSLQCGRKEACPTCAHEVPASTIV